jgi:hypothetical protein
VTDNLSGIVEGAMWAQSAALDDACRRIVDRLGQDAAVERAVHVTGPSGSPFPSHWLRVDGREVWRLWWEQTGEYRWSMRSEWLVDPETLR